MYAGCRFNRLKPIWVKTIERNGSESDRLTKHRYRGTSDRLKNIEFFNIETIAVQGTVRFAKRFPKVTAAYVIGLSGKQKFLFQIMPWNFVNHILWVIMFGAGFAVDEATKRIYHNQMRDVEDLQFGRLATAFNKKQQVTSFLIIQHFMQWIIFFAEKSSSLKTQFTHPCESALFFKVVCWRARARTYHRKYTKTFFY